MRSVRRRGIRALSKVSAGGRFGVGQIWAEEEVEEFGSRRSEFETCNLSPNGAK